MRCIALVFLCCIVGLTLADNGCPTVVKCLANVFQQKSICQKLAPAPNTTTASKTNTTCQTTLKQLEDQMDLQANQRDVTFQQCLVTRNSSALDVKSHFCRNVAEKRLTQPENFTLSGSSVHSGPMVSSGPSASSNMKVNTTVNPSQTEERREMNSEERKCWDRVMEIQMQCEDLYECCSECDICDLMFQASPAFTNGTNLQISIIEQARKCDNATVVGKK